MKTKREAKVVIYDESKFSQDLIKQGYNQALKDFVEECNKLICWNKDVIMKIEDIYRIAKELGGKRWKLKR